MGLVQDNALFAGICREFAIRFVDLTARILHDDKQASFDLENVTEDDRSLLFNLCFFGIANLEAQNRDRSITAQFGPRGRR